MTKIVVSKSGIAFFERTGKTSGAAPAELFFAKTEMNDVLKSLQITSTSKSAEGDGVGAVSSVSFESTKEPEEMLHEVSLRIEQDSTTVLQDVLQQLSGTALEVEIDDNGSPAQLDGLLLQCCVFWC